MSGSYIERPDGLPLNAMKEQFSLGFVQMVAAAAGFSLKRHATDYDGVDITIASSKRHRRFYAPEFELQVKCTSQRLTVERELLAWSLEARAFRKLTDPARFIPAYLGVLVVPGDPEKWLDWNASEAGFETKAEMYWARAADLGEITDGAASKTVRIPQANVFDVSQLRSIMDAIGDGGAL